MTNVFAALLLSAILGETPVGVPKEAKRYVVADGVIVHHWSERVIGRESYYRVYSMLEIEKWPEKAWGVEVTSTPTPNCCGTAPYSAVVTRSQQAGKLYVGEFHEKRIYTISLKFKS